MKDIKVGQWVLLFNNTIVPVKEILSIHKEWFTYNTKNTVHISEVKAVADTPQELIQVGDIISYSKENIRAKHFIKDEQQLKEILLSKSGRMNFIEIWTKTSANTYTRQWVKE